MISVSGKLIEVDRRIQMSYYGLKPELHQHETDILLTVSDTSAATTVTTSNKNTFVKAPFTDANIHKVLSTV